MCTWNPFDRHYKSRHAQLTAHHLKFYHWDSRHRIFELRSSNSYYTFQIYEVSFIGNELWLTAVGSMDSIVNGKKKESIHANIIGKKRVENQYSVDTLFVADRQPTRERTWVNNAHSHIVHGDKSHLLAKMWVKVMQSSEFEQRLLSGRITLNQTSFLSPNGVSDLNFKWHAVYSRFDPFEDQNSVQYLNIFTQSSHWWFFFFIFEYNVRC